MRYIEKVDYMFMRKLLPSVFFVLAVVCNMNINASASAEDSYYYEEQSAGEAWDERYGQGEVAGDYMGTWTVANVDSWVSLRERPDTNSERVTKVPKWADVEAYYYDGNWFECYYNGMRGYIMRDYLTDRPGKYPDYPGNLDEPYVEPTQPSSYYPDQYVEDWQLSYVGEYYIVNCDEWVSLREHADESSTRLAKVPLGTKIFNCYDTVFDFMFCEYNDQYGFIKKEYLMYSDEYERIQSNHQQTGGNAHGEDSDGNKNFTKVAEMDDLFHMWNEYAPLNFYGGDEVGEAEVEWRNGYDLFDNFAGTFINGVPMGQAGNLFGRGYQEPKEWLLSVAQSENGGQNTILRFLSQRMVNVDSVEVVGSELHGWVLGRNDTAAMFSEEEFYEFYVDMYSLGFRYDILVRISTTFDEGDYIASTLIGEYSLDESISQTNYSENDNIPSSSNKQTNKTSFSDSDYLAQGGQYFDYGTERTFVCNLPSWRGNMSVFVIWNNKKLTSELCNYLTNDRWAQYNVDMSFERWDDSDMHMGEQVYTALDDILYEELTNSELSYALEGVNVIFVFGIEPENMTKSIEYCVTHGRGLFINSSSNPSAVYESICDKTTGI